MYKPYQVALPPGQQDFVKAFYEMPRRVEPAQVDVFLHEEEYMDCPYDLR